MTGSLLSFGGSTPGPPPSWRATPADSEFIFDGFEESVERDPVRHVTTWTLGGRMIYRESSDGLGLVKYTDYRKEEDKVSIVTPAEAPPKSCLSCSNFIAAADVPKRYSRQVGVPMCGKFDKPIGRKIDPPMDLPHVATKLAEHCSGYNQPRDSRPARAYKVAFPDPNQDVTGYPAGDDRVKTCHSCKHFASQDVVMTEWGWMTGACSKLGFLVPGHSAVSIGSRCMVSDFGTQRGTMLGVTLFPEYDEEYLTPDLIGVFKKDNAFDPLTHETDRPVTEAQAAKGIRAWYLVRDMERPEYDTGIYLPIYDLNRYDEVERSKVPQTGDDEHPESYLDHNNAVFQIAALWVGLDESPALWGPPGVGKTELGRHLAWIMQLPFIRISVTGSTELDDLAGQMHYVEGQGTEFRHGRLSAAWKKPGIILLDEPNVGQPEVWQFLRPLTDNSKQLVLDMNQGERIDRDDDAFLLMAMNPAWDPRNVGTQVIGDADQRRLMHVSMSMPPEEIEKQIITTRCAVDDYTIPPVTLKAIMGIAKELRGLSDQGTLPTTWGVASQIKVARATQFFSLQQAYRIAVGNFLEPKQADMILDVVKSHDASAPSF